MKSGELAFLVVEDDDFQRGMVIHMLRSLGVVEIHEAGNGRQALEVLHAVVKPVDIAICDMDMPEMDGMEFLRHLGRENGETQVLILSTLDRALLASIENMSKGYGIKLLGVIEKPVSLAQLELLISRYERRDVRPTLPVAAKAAFSLEEIMQAVSQRQFEPFFQPKVDFKTGRIVGAEALARWNHPRLGVIAPYAFIPLLEQAGELDELTFLMLEKSVAACRIQHETGYPVSISVNLSLTSLTDTRLADRITKMVRAGGVDPHHIVLEITESAAMTDVAPAQENLARLRMHGFVLSIDDYGTGYASMQQITRIAFSELKIDQSFVKDFASNQALRVIVESSIEMAHKLRVKSVAEGVETQQDWDTLKGMGCDIAQGYFIARPMNLSAFVEFCRGWPV
jgi:EAL domain-containing protein (putative c-di-GMP-specific phosphodiesterase class I)/AmiR/NasT family two-component response regulator